MNIITLIGVTIIFFYSATNILNFYGVEQEAYNPYMYFYALLLACMIVLPGKNPTL
jgi:hypothetical protein